MNKLWLISISLLLFVAVKSYLRIMVLDIYGLSLESIIAILVAIIFGLLAYKFDKGTEKFLVAITVNQIYEKTAMMYGYIPYVDEWKSAPQQVEFIVKKIRADILSLQNMVEKGTPEQKNELRTALADLLAKMRKNGYQTEASTLQNAFDSLKI